MAVAVGPGMKTISLLIALCLTAFACGPDDDPCEDIEDPEARAACECANDPRCDR